MKTLDPEWRSAMPNARPRSRRVRAALAILIALSAIACWLLASVAHGADGSMLRGTVTAHGQPLAGATVELFAGSREGTSELGRATSDQSGSFTITYVKPDAGVLYLDATPTRSSRLVLRAVVGVGAGGAVPETTLPSARVNELTTVAAAFALAQFEGAGKVAGPSPGLENAAATAQGLADSSNGQAGGVVTNKNNGNSNETLATLNTLANLVSLCSPGAESGACGKELRLAAPRGGTAPADTVQAMVDIARDPTLSPIALDALARRASVYAPVLTGAPSAWILVLKYTEDDLYASGRIAFDAKGNLWSSDNWLPGTEQGSTFVSALNPIGEPVFGAPISGGGMKGGAWGMAITPQGAVWVPSFGGAAMSEYAPTGRPLSPGDGFANGALNHPQGVAIDQTGNVWIANNYGPESDPGQGNVVVYPHGDPSRAITITGGGLNHPFAIQIDGYGRAWVTNAGLGGAKFVGTKAAILVGKFGGSVTVIEPDFKPSPSSPIADASFKWPLGLAIDSQNNPWTANYFNSSVTELRPDGTVATSYKLPGATAPWSEAIDGSDRVWVAGFARPAVWLLCGVEQAACQPEASTGAFLSPRLGFRSKSFEHFTSIQIDQSGDVWLSNNWAKLKGPDRGGVGVDEIVGAATPVCTPMQPLPQQPSSVSETACPRQVAASLPDSLSAPSASGDSDPLPVWAWALIGLAGVLVLAGLVVRRNRTGSAA